LIELHPIPTSRAPPSQNTGEVSGYTSGSATRRPVALHIRLPQRVTNRPVGHVSLGSAYLQ
jgi:hypothetical protein